MDYDKLLEVDGDPNFSENKKNCIRYVMTEKKVLMFLRECAQKVNELVEMTVEEADNQVKMWAQEEEWSDN